MSARASEPPVCLPGHSQRVGALPLRPVPAPRPWLLVARPVGCLPASLTLSPGAALPGLSLVS